MTGDWKRLMVALSRGIYDVDPRSDMNLRWTGTEAIRHDCGAALVDEPARRLFPLNHGMNLIQIQREVNDGVEGKEQSSTE